jgi:hypothetical protein
VIESHATALTKNFILPGRESRSPKQVGERETPERPKIDHAVAHRCCRFMVAQDLNWNQRICVLGLTN